ANHQQSEVRINHKDTKAVFVSLWLPFLSLIRCDIVFVLIHHTQEGNMKNFFALLFSFLFFTASFAAAQTKRNLTIDDLYALKGVSQPQVSPDGKWIAYVVRTYDQKTDKSNRDVYMIPYAGGDAIQLTTSEKSDTHPRWSPDNKYLAFLSGRNKKDQVFL